LFQSKKENIKIIDAIKGENPNLDNQNFEKKLEKISFRKTNK
jgi:hypothetical protein